MSELLALIGLSILAFVMGIGTATLIAHLLTANGIALGLLGGVTLGAASFLTFYIALGVTFIACVWRSA